MSPNLGIMSSKYVTGFPRGTGPGTQTLFFFLILLICLFGCVGSSLTLGLSLVVAQGLLIAVSSLVAEH